MSTKKITVLGFTNQEDRFIVHSGKISVSNDQKIPSALGSDSFEQLLAGFAASLNTTGRVIAKEQNFDLKAVQIEITASYNDEQISNKPKNNLGLKKINVILKPVTEGSLTELKIWMDTIKERCPFQANISKTTPVLLTVIKEFTYPKAA